MTDRKRWPTRRMGPLGLVLGLAVGEAAESSAQSRSSSSRVVAKHSGMCMEVSGKGLEDGATVWQARCTGARNQSFRFRRVAGGDYEILVELSGKCLQIGRRGELQQYRCIGIDAQKFQLNRDAYSDYQIAAKATGLCLTVEKQSRSDRARVIQGDCRDQKWKVSIDPERK